MEKYTSTEIILMEEPTIITNEFDNHVRDMEYDENLDINAGQIIRNTKSEEFFITHITYEDQKRTITVTRKLSE